MAFSLCSLVMAMHGQYIQYVLSMVMAHPYVNRVTQSRLIHVYCNTNMYMIILRGILPQLIVNWLV